MTSIKGAIGNNMKNDPEDVKTIKEALHETGHMVREDLENGYITQALDKAVKGFQRIHDLKIDGILKPNGETAQALALAQQRKKAILEGSNADFTVTPNPQASSDQPWYALKSYSEVTPNEKTIDALSKAAKVDPDLVKSIIYVETTQGWYDRAGVLVDKNRSIRPMNIDSDRWKSLGYTREQLENPENNIKAGVTLINKIDRHMPDATIEQKATIYNSLGAHQVTDYGARVGYVYRQKPWMKK